MVCGTLSCQSVVIPSEDLRADFLTWRYGMFIHFGMATFTGGDWTNGYEDPRAFSPDRFDPGQWADVAVAAGMKYGVLTTKHTGGWALWDSEHTDHDASAMLEFQQGSGDVVAEFVHAFRSRGLRVGLYYCMAGDYDGRFGNPVPPGPSLHGFPPEANGDYAGFARKQLTELLTRYGPIDLVWIDQARSPYMDQAAWHKLRRHIRKTSPSTLILANEQRTSSESDVHSYELPLYAATDPAAGLPSTGNTEPAEVSDTIGPSWFWNEGHTPWALKSAEYIAEMLTTANARSANYLLNVPPDTSGLLPAASIERLMRAREVAGR